MQCIKCKTDFVPEEVIEDDEDYCPSCKEKNKAIAQKIDVIIQANREKKKDKAKLPGFDYQKARSMKKGVISYMNV